MELPCPEKLSPSTLTRTGKLANPGWPSRDAWIICRPIGAVPTSTQEAVSTPRQKLRPQLRSLARPQTDSLLIGAVAALTLLGLAIRLSNFNQSLLGDELSTYWILHGHSLGDVLSSIRSNDEISPPLYFILGWLSLKVGSGPEWMRLPSLLAGTAAIPLVYLLGMRTVSRAAGLVAAAVMALSPFMIYYSTEARSYALMIALLIGSTLALLAAVESRRARWWVVYAVCSCGALYSHYTAVFPLAAQFVWALWAHREAIRALLLANLGVLLGFAPWIPGFIDDSNSPTQKILSSLEPFTYHAVRLALENWSVGYPYVRTAAVPGNLAALLIAAGVVIAAAAGGLRAWRWLRSSSLPLGAALRRIPPGIVLVAMLALATPVGEAVYSAFGTNLLGARNMNASWPGLALAIGAVVTAAGPMLSFACAALVISGFAIGGVKTLEARFARIDYRDATGAIEKRWAPGDAVVDVPAPTPVPLTGLDVYLPQTNPEFRLGLPVSEHPFAIGDPVPPPNRLIAGAIRSAKGKSIFLVTPLPTAALSSPVRGVARQQRKGLRLGADLLRRARPQFGVTYRQTFRGVVPLAVIELEYRGGRG
jgi:Dolichyl-phosphate-mannose-protein mannosyltransferase